MEENTINIKWQELFKPITGLKTDVLNRIVIEREVIPVIFVPGIMGSRLENSAGKKAWDPDAGGFMLMNFGFFTVTAKERKDLLIGDQFNPEHLKVSNNDTKHNKKFNNDKDATREERGWGGIFWGSYGDFLIELQNHQWDEPIRQCFEFPVHAFGYNWTDSNDNSGKKLAEEITAIIKKYTSKGRICKHVILISHSMGGLVCRSACVLHKASDNVLGVLHGVQPATGAPAAYWRMKAGFDRPHGNPSWILWDWLRNPLKMAGNRILGRIMAWTLGTDGEEVTSILCNAPGGLELLPNKHYTNNEGKPEWLHVPNQAGVVSSFPRSGDPYKEIYEIKDDVYWRMVNPEWLDPGRKEINSDPDNPGNIRLDPWEQYLKHLRLTQGFHSELKTKFHEHTYQFYSSSYETVDEIKFSREKYSMYLDKDTDTGIEIDYPVYNSSKGEHIVYLKHDDSTAHLAKEVAYKVKMAMPKEYKEGGDATVPNSSGRALTVMKTAQIGVDSRSDWFVQDHQGVYKSNKGKELAYIAVNNFSIKRIKDEIRAF